MPTPLVVAQSRTYPVALEPAFVNTLTIPLERIFSKRFGPIPPIVRTEQDGMWGTVGQVRRIHTADGGSLREELVTVDRPNVFAYVLTEVTGPMKPLVDHVEGRWSFDEVGTGTRITWQWTIHPRGALGGGAMPVFGRIWKGYARRSLDRLEGLLLAA